MRLLNKGKCDRPIDHRAPKILSRPHLTIAVTLLAVVLQGCSLPGGRGARRGASDVSRQAQNASAARPAEATRLSANDQIRLRLTDLRIALALKPEQATNWQAYEGSVIDMLSEFGSNAGNESGGSVLDQLDQRISRQRAHAATMERVFTAIRMLYASLGDEQRHVADRMLASTIPLESLGLAAPARGPP